MRYNNSQKVARFTIVREKENFPNVKLAKEKHTFSVCCARASALVFILSIFYVVVIFNSSKYC